MGLSVILIVAFPGHTHLFEEVVYSVWYVMKANTMTFLLETECVYYVYGEIEVEYHFLLVYMTLSHVRQNCISMIL